MPSLAEIAAGGLAAYDLAVFRWAFAIRGKRHRPHRGNARAFLNGSREDLLPLRFEAIPICVAIRQIWLVGLHTSLGDRFGWGRSMTARPSHSSERAPREEQAPAAWRNTLKIYVFPHIGANAGSRHRRGNGRVPPGFSPLQSFYAYALRLPLVRLAAPVPAKTHTIQGDLDRQLRASAAEHVPVPAIDAEDCFDPAARIQPQCRNADGLDDILYWQQSGHCRQPCPAHLAVLDQCQMRAPSARRNPIPRRRRSQRAGTPAIVAGCAVSQSARTSSAARDSA
jgi:hypothetical protein